MFHLIFSLPGLYVIGRFLWPLPWPLQTRIVLAVVVLLASQYHLFSRLSSGSPFSPEMPRTVVIALNWAFAALVLLAVFQLLTDLATLIAMLVRRQGLTIPSAVRYAMGAAALMLSAIGVGQAIRVPRSRM